MQARHPLARERQVCDTCTNAKLAGQSMFEITGDPPMCSFLRQLWFDDQGQDIAEYAVMLAVILVIVVGTIRLIGSNANTVFSEAASSIQ
jgi:Flp pilus assembly pilin Flp